MPLYTGPWDGDRKSDKIVRKAVIKVGGHSATVGHVNSLRGACLVQGALSAVKISELWPRTMVTESHPKALLAVYPLATKFMDEFHFKNDHERDAALGAYTAYSFTSKWNGWVNLYEDEKSIYIPSGSNIAYWFP